MAKIHFHGHACFEVIDGDTKLLFDPFLKPNNPVADVDGDGVDPTEIFVTHGHPDHVSHLVEVAQRTKAPVSALLDIAEWLHEQDVKNINGLNMGGTLTFNWGWAKFVQAFHTNTLPDGTAIGMAGSWIVNIAGKTIWHVGDTALFGDMKLIAEQTPVDIVLLPIGGHFTMDRHDAVVAVKLIGAQTVIPCHYNTFPKIQTDDQAFKADIEAQTSSRVEILRPGESFEF